MPGPAPFLFPDSRWIRFRGRVARAERLARGLVRRIRAGEALATTADRKLLRHASEHRMRAVPAAADGAAQRPPVIHLAALAWADRFQRPQQLARALVADRAPVLYVEAFERASSAPRRGAPNPRPSCSRE